MVIENDFVLYKRKENCILKSNDLSEIFTNWKNNNEYWLFISPHDDDIILGSGLLLEKAKQDDVKIIILIITDGSLGYNNIKNIKKISTIRKKETIDCYKSIGITNIEWLNFPDCNLNLFVGRRKAKWKDPCVIKNFTGLQNAFTYYLRKYSPTRIFLPSNNDYHVDHKTVYQELMISVIHSKAIIWPELGISIDYIPYLYELAIYNKFDGIPDIKIVGNEGQMFNKISAIKKFKSQEKLIDIFTDRINNSEAVEYFKEIPFNIYSPDDYKKYF
jgi:LmbE family N-acetylglucosaminyl deacetylase